MPVRKLLLREKLQAPVDGSLGLRRPQVFPGLYIESVARLLRLSHRRECSQTDRCGPESHVRHYLLRSDSALKYWFTTSRYSIGTFSCRPSRRACWDRGERPLNPRPRLSNLP